VKEVKTYVREHHPVEKEVRISSHSCSLAGLLFSASSALLHCPNIRVTKQHGVPVAMCVGF